MIGPAWAVITSHVHQ